MWPFNFTSKRKAAEREAGLQAARDENRQINRWNEFIYSPSPNYSPSYSNSPHNASSYVAPSISWNAIQGSFTQSIDQEQYIKIQEQLGLITSQEAAAAMAKLRLPKPKESFNPEDKASRKGKVAESLTAVKAKRKVKVAKELGAVKAKRKVKVAKELGSLLDGEPHPGTLDEYRYKVRDLKEGEDPNLISSIAEGETELDDDSIHFPCLDIDFGAKLVPSQTPGHYHLYLNCPITWAAYKKLLLALADAGIIELGFAQASIDRGFTAVRPPLSHVYAMLREHMLAAEDPFESGPMAGWLQEKIVGTDELERSFIRGKNIEGNPEWYKAT